MWPSPTCHTLFCVLLASIYNEVIAKEAWQHNFITMERYWIHWISSLGTWKRGQFIQRSHLCSMFGTHYTFMAEAMNHIHGKKGGIGSKLLHISGENKDLQQLDLVLAPGELLAYSFVLYARHVTWVRSKNIIYNPYSDGLRFTPLWISCAIVCVCMSLFSLEEEDHPYSKLQLPVGLTPHAETPWACRRLLSNS